MKDVYKKIKGLERKAAIDFENNHKLINAIINLKSYNGAESYYRRPYVKTEVKEALQFGTYFCFSDFEVPERLTTMPSKFKFRTYNGLACSESVWLDEDLPF